MKVLVNNFGKVNAIEETVEVRRYPRKVICDKCMSELEYEESDLRMGTFGCMHLDCPLCGESIMLDDNENNITLTANSVEFPTHFWHTSVETGAVDVCDNENIKKYLHEAINYFRNNKEEFAWFTYTGNLCMHVYRFDGDENYEVFISNDYYNMSIPFEDKDYE